MASGALPGMLGHTGTTPVCVPLDGISRIDVSAVESYVEVTSTQGDCLLLWCGDQKRRMELFRISVRGELLSLRALAGEIRAGARREDRGVRLTLGVPAGRGLALSLCTATGDLSADGLDIGSVSLRSGTGGVRLSAAAPLSVVAASISGSIWIELPSRGAYAPRAHSETGHVSIAGFDGAQEPPHDALAIECSTSCGDVSITLK